MSPLVSYQQAPGALAVPEGLAADVYERGQAFHARASGLDAVEFLLAAGPAEPLRPLVCLLGLQGSFCEDGLDNLGRYIVVEALAAGRRSCCVRSCAC